MRAALSDLNVPRKWERSASTGGNAAGAKTVAAVASASTDGGAPSARSAAAAASASMGGGAASARSAAVAVP